jgi:hypothetical protein
MEKKEKKSIKLNIGFIDLVKDIKENKVNIDNLEVLKSEYKNYCSVKSVKNIDRVYKRVLRVDLRENFLSYLKSNNLKEKEFLDISLKVINNLREKKESRFIKVDLVN